MKMTMHDYKDELLENLSEDEVKTSLRNALATQEPWEITRKKLYRKEVLKARDHHMALARAVCKIMHKHGRRRIPENILWLFDRETIYRCEEGVLMADFNIEEAWVSWEDVRKELDLPDPDPENPPKYKVKILK